LLKIAREHPEYVNRRSLTELRVRGFYVNHKVIERLHSYWALSVIRRFKHSKGSSIRALLKEAVSKVNLVLSLEQISDFKVLYTDFTEICYRNGSSKAQFMAIIDHRSKPVVEGCARRKC